MAEERKGKNPTKQELLDILRRMTRGEQKPSSVRELFEPEDGDLTMRSESPPRMVHTLVRMKVLEAARDPERNESLVTIFIREYDKRMISLNRKGRLELLGALQALAESETERMTALK